jgi:hypothetical protein
VAGMRVGKFPASAIGILRRVGELEGSLQHLTKPFENTSHTPNCVLTALIVILKISQQEYRPISSRSVMTCFFWRSFVERNRPIESSDMHRHRERTAHAVRDLRSFHSTDWDFAEV